MLNQIELAGPYYEIGLEVGKILKETPGYPPKYSQEILEKSHAYEKQVGIYAPGLLDEFKGIADGMGIDYYVPVTLEATPYRFQTSNCFVMAIAGEHTLSGKPVLAHNHEWMESDSKNLRLCTTSPKGNLKSLGFTFHWPLVSRYGGINEAGLALAFTSADFENGGAGIMLNLAARWILDTCETTEEVVAFLERIPKVWGETYVMIDRKNTIAKVESHRQKTKVTYTDTGFEWNSLLYDSPEMQPCMSQERIDSCAAYSSARGSFLQEWFQQHRGRISDDMIMEALKSHEHKMCVHDLEGLEICWSYMLKDMADDVLVCAGRPCKNEYVKVQVP